MSLNPIIESVVGNHVSLSTVLRSSTFLLQYKKKITLDSTELRVCISILFTGEKRNVASSYGNQNILYNCLHKIDKKIKKQFLTIISNFGILRCSNRAIHYITGIYTLHDYSITNDYIITKTLFIDHFLSYIIEIFYYLKLKKINLKMYNLLLKIISNENPIEIIWDVEKTLYVIKQKIKNKYYVNIDFSNKLLDIIL